MYEGQAQSTKHSHKTKNREIRTSLNTEGELRCSGRVRYLKVSIKDDILKWYVKWYNNYTSEGINNWLIFMEWQYYRWPVVFFWLMFCEPIVHFVLFLLALYWISIYDCGFLVSSQILYTHWLLNMLTLLRVLSQLLQRQLLPPQWP